MKEQIAWDHIMLNVLDLEKSMASFNQAGICFQLGGKHPQWGTYNGLGYFGLTYLEMISVYDAEIAKTVTEDAIPSVYQAVTDYAKKQERFNTIAFRTTDIKETRARLQQQGISVGEIEPGQRKDPKGNLITWSMLFLSKNNDSSLVPEPFFIQWDQPDDKREQTLQQQGIALNHPVSVTEGIIMCEEPSKVATHWGQLIDQKPVYEQDAAYLMVGDQRLSFELGTSNRLTEVRLKGADASLKKPPLTIGSAVFKFV